MNGEKWRCVIGYEDYYKVSNLGRVRIVKRGRYWRTNAFLQPHRSSGGYFQIHLSKDRQRTSPMLHRIVAQAWVPNADRKPYTNHRDGDKSNNAASNLEWMTASENISHAYRTGLCPSGERHNRARLSARKVAEIRSLRGRISQRTLAKRYGVNKSTINSLLNGHSWKHVA